ncbi:MAG: hypothetical protein U9R19_08240 [Bacteroidota bacterium]|nr:hypothetical protein [Bacteroidota bacterium]
MRKTKNKPTLGTNEFFEQLKAREAECTRRERLINKHLAAERKENKKLEGNYSLKKTATSESWIKRFILENKLERVARIEKQITTEQEIKLNAKYHRKDIIYALEGMDNWKKEGQTCNRRYVSVYHALARTWLKDAPIKQNITENSKAERIPKWFKKMEEGEKRTIDKIEYTKENDNEISHKDKNNNILIFSFQTRRWIIKENFENEHNTRYKDVYKAERTETI